MLLSVLIVIVIRLLYLRRKAKRWIKLLRLVLGVNVNTKLEILPQLKYVVCSMRNIFDEWDFNVVSYYLQVVVIIVVWVISLLLVYMMFLICLDPLLNNRLRRSNYVEHTNEEVCSLMEDYYHAERLVSALYVLPKKKPGGIFCSKPTSDEITYSLWCMLQ